MMRGARIVIFVDAMAEAHQYCFAGFHALDVRGNVGERADFEQHAEDFFVGAAVERAVERGRGGGGGRVGIDVRTSHAAHGVRGTILFVVGVQDEENIERAFESGIGTVLQLRGAEEHVQEIAAIAQIVVGIRERHSQTVPISKRRQRGHLADRGGRSACGAIPD